MVNGEVEASDQAENLKTQTLVPISNLPELNLENTEPSRDQGDGWIISFLDMMILVLTFFVAFIATQMPTASFLASQDSAADTEMTTTIGELDSPVPGSNLITPIPALRQRADDIAGNDRVDIQQSNDGVTLTIDDRFVFASGRADISLEGSQTIERLVPLLQDLSGKIEVYGHTDNIPIRTDRFETNWELSAARAVNIVRLLITEGVDEGRLRAVGVAHTQPVATNATKLGRSKNRRVEIQVREQ